MSSHRPTPGGRTADLTDNQVVAAASTEQRLFIDAGPGTGKTTVAARRFGVERFAAIPRRDHRAVMAVSFTRAATQNLQQRVRRTWGPSALSWPHRIVTLDTIMKDLLHDLLRARLLHWPHNHLKLNVVDSWNTFAQNEWTASAYEVQVESATVEFVRVQLASASRVPFKVVKTHLTEGRCTHQDVRGALDAALADPEIAERVRTRLGETTRALIVDEVFDADDLDIKVIDLAMQAHVSVTLVGDPWQALYAFRGARPDAIPALLKRTKTRTFALTESFRWRSLPQRQLAEKLRAGHGIDIESVGHDIGASEVDVVLALTWKQLWKASDEILPLAFQGFKGGAEEAAATLLLNHMTTTILGQPATYLRDSLLALAITEPKTVDQLHDDLQRVLDLLAEKNADVGVAYTELTKTIGTVSPRTFRGANHHHTRRLKNIAARLDRGSRPILGLTTHQAKGGEWNTVVVAVSDSERTRLQTGLSHTDDADRKLYVACTRARYRTALTDA